MFQRQGKDNTQFWLSTLVFECPLPKEVVQAAVSRDLWLDIIPIRTPPRYSNFLFTQDHMGLEYIRSIPIFNTTREWGDGHVLPRFSDSGRWANIPICKRTPSPPSTERHYKLVACTWMAASYTRRGDAVIMDDTVQRLREWVLFHQMVGFERIYVYDNTISDRSPLEEICNEFDDFVVYHKWPAQVCNNNRPGNPSPGERSSQYAAEASCREQYGPMTDWMAFIDEDEYLVPMSNQSETWHGVLKDMDSRGMKILKMRSARAKPRLDLMEYVAGAHCLFTMCCVCIWVLSISNSFPLICLQ